MKELHLLADKFSGVRITLELSKEQIKTLPSEHTFTNGFHAPSGKDRIRVTVWQTEFLTMEQ